MSAPTTDRYRHAGTGEYVTEEFANAHPGVTVKESDTPSALARIERKLDTLISALAGDEDEEQEETTLDGEAAGGERDQSQSL